MDKKEIRSKFSSGGEDAQFVGRLLDKIEQAEKYTVYTKFLNPHERTIARRICEYLHTRYAFFGGYDDAERVIMAVLADYEDENMLNFPIRMIAVEASRFARRLTHRDYLGSLMGLQITRESIGDIVVDEGRAQMFVCEAVNDFIVDNLNKVGNETVLAKAVDMEAFYLPEREVVMQTVRVASLRLDCLVSEIFHLPRSKAVEFIATGNVFLRFEECCKAAAEVREGDILSLRGYGRAKVMQIGGISRKGRTAVTVQKEI